MHTHTHLIIFQKLQCNFFIPQLPQEYTGQRAYETFSPHSHLVFPDAQVKSCNNAVKYPLCCMIQIASDVPIPSTQHDFMSLMVNILFMMVIEIHFYNLAQHYLTSFNTNKILAKTRKCSHLLVLDSSAVKFINKQTNQILSTAFKLFKSIFQLKAASVELN